MIEPKDVVALKNAGVALDRDTVLCLRPLIEIEDEIQRRTVIHQVRTLGTLRLSYTESGSPVFKIHDPVREEIEAWKASSQSDFKKIMARLVTVATNKEINNTNILKRISHREARGLCEVVGKGDHARLFVFFDDVAGSVVICAGTYWKQGRSVNKERVAQDAAILKAEERRSLWSSATPLMTNPEWRFKKGSRT